MLLPVVLQVLNPGIIGGLLLPVLGAFPDTLLIAVRAPRRAHLQLNQNLQCRSVSVSAVDRLLTAVASYQSFSSCDFQIDNFKQTQLCSSAGVWAGRLC